MTLEAGAENPKLDGKFQDKEFENFCPLKRWLAAKNLTRELLRCNEQCVSSNFRTVFPIKKPKWKFSIINFVNVASRKSAPGERASKKVLYFRPLMDILLRHNLPETFIVNKLLLSDNPSRAGRSGRAPHFDPDVDWGPGYAEADDADSADFDEDEFDRFGYRPCCRGRGCGRGRCQLLRLSGRGSRHTQTFTKLCLLAIETNEVCPFRAVQKAFSLTIKKPAINDFFFIF